MEAILLQLQGGVQHLQGSPLQFPCLPLRCGLSQGGNCSPVLALGVWHPSYWYSYTLSTKFSPNSPV